MVFLIKGDEMKIMQQFGLLGFVFLVGSLCPSLSWAAVVANVLTYGSTIELKHVGTGKLLHFLDFPYTHIGSSGQKKITGFDTEGDVSNYWVVKGPYKEGDRWNCVIGDPVQEGDIVRFENKKTFFNLHSHSIPSPITGQNEVSGYATLAAGDGNDNWKFADVQNNSLVKGNSFRLIHVETNCALHSHALSDPVYTNGQQEITAYSGRDANDLWTINEFYSMVTDTSVVINTSISGEYDSGYNPKWKLPSVGSGAVVFDAVPDKKDALIVNFTSDAKEGADGQMYMLVLAGYNNQGIVIRKGSITTTNIPYIIQTGVTTIIDGNSSYWASLTTLGNGNVVISYGTGRTVGANQLGSWTDTSPIVNLQYVGFGASTNRIAYSNIEMKAAFLPTVTTPTTTVPVTTTTLTTPLVITTTIPTPTPITTITTAPEIITTPLVTTTVEPVTTMPMAAMPVVAVPVTTITTTTPSYEQEMLFMPTEYGLGLAKPGVVAKKVPAKVVPKTPAKATVAKVTKVVTTKAVTTKKVTTSARVTKPAAQPTQRVVTKKAPVKTVTVPTKTVKKVGMKAVVKKVMAKQATKKTAAKVVKAKTVTKVVKKAPVKKEVIAK